MLNNLSLMWDIQVDTMRTREKHVGNVALKKRNKKDNRLDRREKYITGKFMWRSQCFEPHSSGDNLKSATL